MKCSFVISSTIINEISGFYSFSGQKVVGTFIWSWHLFKYLYLNSFQNVLIEQKIQSIPRIYFFYNKTEDWALVQNAALVMKIKVLKLGLVR